MLASPPSPRIYAKYRYPFWNWALLWEPCWRVIDTLVPREHLLMQCSLLWRRRRARDDMSASWRAAPQRLYIAAVPARVHSCSRVPRHQLSYPRRGPCGVLSHANMMAVMVGVMALLSQHVNCAAGAAPTLGPADHVTVRSEQHIFQNQNQHMHFCSVLCCSPPAP